MDVLESLSNADLRAKCIQNGLPNVPVTDSSRKVLIKKLHAILSGTAATPGSAQKKSNRRETIHVTKVEAAAPVIEDKHDGSTANRSATRLNNRRTVGGISSPAPAPVSDRRRSVREQQEHIVTKTNTSTTGRLYPTVVLESDEDEEEDLVNAAHQAEMLNRSGNLSRPASRSSRGGSLSKTSVVTTSYTNDFPTVPEVNETDLGNSKFGRVTDGPRVDLGTRGSAQFTTEPITSRSVYTQSFQRTFDSSHYGTPQSALTTSTKSNYQPAVSSSLSSSAYMRRSTPAGSVLESKKVYEEMSDDNDAIDEPFESPYLSNFTRNLERLKAEPLRGGMTSISSGADARRYQRHTIYGGGGITSMHGRYDNSFGATVQRYWTTLDRKYHLKRNLIIVLIILILIFLYVLITP